VFIKYPAKYPFPKLITTVIIMTFAIPQDPDVFVLQNYKPETYS